MDPEPELAEQKQNITLEWVEAGTAEPDQYPGRKFISDYGTESRH